MIKRIENGTGDFRHLAGMLAAATLLTAFGGAAHAVDPVPIQPLGAIYPRAASEGTNKNTIAESNDYFYIDDDQKFRVSFAPRSFKKRILMLQVSVSAYGYVDTALHVRPSITVQDPAFPGDPSHLLTFNLNPGADAVHYCGIPTGQCALSSTWWQDFDANPSLAAAVDHVPVNIDVEVFTDSTSEFMDGRNLHPGAGSEEVVGRFAAYATRRCGSASPSEA
jgi:hypothetical protein